VAPGPDLQWDGDEWLSRCCEDGSKELSYVCRRVNLVFDGLLMPLRCLFNGTDIAVALANAEIADEEKRRSEVRHMYRRLDGVAPVLDRPVWVMRVLTWITGQRHATAIHAGGLKLDVSALDASIRERLVAVRRTVASFLFRRAREILVEERARFEARIANERIEASPRSKHRATLDVAEKIVGILEEFFAHDQDERVRASVAGTFREAAALRDTAIRLLKW
jgi:hypothetical protein